MTRPPQKAPTHVAGPIYVIVMYRSSIVVWLFPPRFGSVRRTVRGQTPKTPKIRQSMFALTKKNTEDAQPLQTRCYERVHL